MTRFIAVALIALAMTSPANAALIKTPFAQKVATWHDITQDVLAGYKFERPVEFGLVQGVLSWSLLRCGGVPGNQFNDMSSIVGAGGEMGRAAKELLGALVMSEHERWPSADFCQYARDTSVKP